MTEKRSRYPVDVVPRPSLILKDCARLTAEHDRIAATYRDLSARLDQSIYKRRTTPKCRVLVLSIRFGKLRQERPDY